MDRRNRLSRWFWDWGFTVVWLLVIVAGGLAVAFACLAVAGVFS